MSTTQCSVEWFNFFLSKPTPIFYSRYFASPHREKWHPLHSDLGNDFLFCPEKKGTGLWLLKTGTYKYVLQNYFKKLKSVSWSHTWRKVGRKGLCVHVSIFGRAGSRFVKRKRQPDFEFRPSSLRSLSHNIQYRDIGLSLHTPKI